MMTPEQTRALAVQVGTSSFAIGELLKEHPEREAWLLAAPAAEVTAYCRAWLRAKPDDLRTAS